MTTTTPMSATMERAIMLLDRRERDWQLIDFLDAVEELRSTAGELVEAAEHATTCRKAKCEDCASLADDVKVYRDGTDGGGQGDTRSVFALLDIITNHAHRLEEEE